MDFITMDAASSINNTMKFKQDFVRYVKKKFDAFRFWKVSVDLKRIRDWIKNFDTICRMK